METEQPGLCIISDCDGAWSLERKLHFGLWNIREESPQTNKNRQINKQETLKTVSVSSAKRDMEELAGDSNCTCKGPGVGRRSGSLLRAERTHSVTYLTNGEMRLRR